MKYQEWLNGCGCCPDIQDCPPSTGNPCDCDSILLELSKQHTDDLVLQDEIDALSGAVEDKQDKLTAGTGIDITDNVISVTGGGESSGITSGEVQTMIDESMIKLQDVIKNLQNEINALKAQINGN